MSTTKRTKNVIRAVGKPSEPNDNPSPSSPIPATKRKGHELVSVATGAVLQSSWQPWEVGDKPGSKVGPRNHVRISVTHTPTYFVGYITSNRKLERSLYLMSQDADEVARFNSITLQKASIKVASSVNMHEVNHTKKRPRDWPKLPLKAPAATEQYTSAKDAASQLRKFNKLFPEIEFIIITNTRTIIDDVAIPQFINHVVGDAKEAFQRVKSTDADTISPGDYVVLNGYPNDGIAKVIDLEGRMGRQTARLSEPLQGHTYWLVRHLTKRPGPTRIRKLNKGK